MRPRSASIRFSAFLAAAILPLEHDRREPPPRWLVSGGFGYPSGLLRLVAAFMIATPGDARYSQEIVWLEE